MLDMNDRAEIEPLYCRALEIIEAGKIVPLNRLLLLKCIIGGVCYCISAVHTRRRYFIYQKLKNDIP
jgi:hypothetical protein